MNSQNSIQSPESIYQLTEDKQRIVITGNQARPITAMIVHTLTVFNRKFDFITDGESNEDQVIKKSNPALLIVEASLKPFSGIKGYHHHIGVISDLDDSSDSINNVTQFADATPKAGILIYFEKGISGQIGKTARIDVTSIPYSTYNYKDDNGKIMLVTSTKEYFPIRISGERNLESLSAAKEVLKKIGITSGQFYKAMSTFVA